jgi:hypothetical protein
MARSTHTSARSKARGGKTVTARRSVITSNAAKSAPPTRSSWGATNHITSEEDDKVEPPARAAWRDEYAAALSDIAYDIPDGLVVWGALAAAAPFDELPSKTQRRINNVMNELKEMGPEATKSAGKAFGREKTKLRAFRVRPLFRYRRGQRY